MVFVFRVSSTRGIVLKPTKHPFRLCPVRRISPPPPQRRSGLEAWCSPREDRPEKNNRPDTWKPPPRGVIRCTGGQGDEKHKKEFSQKIEQRSSGYICRPPGCTREGRLWPIYMRSSNRHYYNNMGQTGTQQLATARDAPFFTGLHPNTPHLHV